MPTEQPEETKNLPIERGVMTVYRSRRQLMSANFMGGIAWGLGTVIGATIVVAFLITVLNALGTLPYIGDVITNTITKSVEAGVNSTK